MFWSKKEKKDTANDKIFDKIVETLKLIEVDITKLKAEVESINGKLRKKIYREADGGDDGNGSKKYPDPFHEVRESFKNNPSLGLKW